MDDEGTKTVSINKGRPGMDQWSILVLGSLRVGLNTDYDRILGV
jgi:transposase, IS5 family